MASDVPAILLIGTLDTKGDEIGYVRDILRNTHALPAIVLDAGILGEPLAIVPEIDRETVAAAAGEGENLQAICAAGSRGAAVARMCRGVARIALKLYQEGKVSGVLCLGGAEGSVLGAAAMQCLPIGVPKLIVSPVASGRRPFAPLIGRRDVMVMHSVTDILGLNPISTVVLRNAAAALAGMVRVEARVVIPDTARLVALTMLGNTTRAVMQAKRLLEAAQLETIIFHANGVGGPAMDELITSGTFCGVIDYTPQELADNLVGGYHRAGPARMEAAIEAGIPLVVVTSCLDFSVHGPRESVPAHLADRPSYYHNPELTLVRLTADEMESVGRALADKLNRARGAACVVVPHGGLSIANVPGGALYDPAADERFFAALCANLQSHIRIVDIPDHANSPACARVAVEEFLKLAEHLAPVTTSTRG
jgi:uncharacterized protein (UPF0261 family)